MSTTARAVEPMIAELEMEAAATKRLLELVPADKLTWKPHDKSMTLGQLALHVASIPGNVSGFLEMDGFDVSQARFIAPQPETRDQILTAFAEGIPAAKKRLAAVDEAGAVAPWRLHRAGTEIFTRKKIEVMRSILLNHLYHHRGQLTVYLRMHDVALPATYGRSADESPFG